MKKSLIAAAILASFSAYANTETSSTLELGENAQTQGSGAIATGKNAVAIGTNAVATGNNETKAQLEAKLKENEQTLSQIKLAEQTLTDSNTALTNLKNLNASIIESGVRVEQVRQAKENARLKWQAANEAYNTANSNYATEIAEAQSKVDLLNSRLASVSVASNFNISSESKLAEAAAQFKQQVETGTTINLSQDFYQSYIKNYYANLGDLRLNNIKLRELTNIPSILRSDVVDDTGLYTYYYNKKQTPSTVYVIDDNYNVTKQETNSYGYLFKGNDEASYTYSRIALGTNNLSITHSNTWSAWLSDATGTLDSVKQININTDIISASDYNTVKPLFDKYRIAVKNYILGNTDPILTDEIRQQAIQQYQDQITYFERSYDIAFYQGKYEETGDLSWLDKKQAAITEKNNLNSDNYEKVYAAHDNLYNNYYNEKIRTFEKTKIRDIEQSNKVQLATLTTQLEQALAINRNAVTEKQAELESLKAQAEQAKTNYENINPTQADLTLSAEYERVQNEITAKTETIAQQQALLNNLRASLTFDTSSSEESNAIAWGTNAAVTAKNAVGIGTNATATGENSIALGKDSSVTGKDSIAIGVGHQVSGNNSTVIGDPNTVTGNNVFVGGNNNVVNSDNAVVIGNNVNVGTGFDGSVVLGNNSAVATANAVTSLTINGVDYALAGTAPASTVSFGAAGLERQLTNVAAGQVSATSTDAVNGSQLFATIQALTSLNTKVNGLSGTTSTSTSTGSSTTTTTATLDSTQLDAINGKILTAQTRADTAHTRIDDLDQKTVQYNTAGTAVSLKANSGTGTKVKNVANGEVSATSQEAVNGSQLYEVSTVAQTAAAKADVNAQNISTNSSRISSLEQSQASTNQRVDRLEHKLRSDRKRSDAGAASAAAIAIIPQVTQANEMGVGVGTATKNGQSALAVGLSKSSQNGKHIFKLATSYDTQHNFVGAAGYLYKW